MPTDTERRLEALENLLLFGGGVAAATASGRALAGAAVRRAPMAASRLVGKHPVATVVALGYTAHRLGLGPIETAELIADELAMPALETTPGTPQFFKKEKRKVSKANKAVKHAMSLLKAGSKRATGADKGKLPKGAFLTSVRAAGLANPRTPSRIKGKGKIKNLARKLKRWW
jgi:hypothetical protein